MLHEVWSDGRQTYRAVDDDFPIDGKGDDSTDDDDSDDEEEVITSAFRGGCHFEIGDTVWWRWSAGTAQYGKIISFPFSFKAIVRYKYKGKTSNVGRMLAKLSLTEKDARKL